MRFQALACDYDGTLATDGAVAGSTLEALERLRASGRKLLLVTGRQLDDLERVFPRLDLFARVVAENGALLHDPERRESRVLAERPPAAFVERLRARGVKDVASGAVIVATWTPHEIEVLETIREMGLELQVIFNKGAVMVLPSGVNKGTGLHAALGELALSAHNCAGIGDAENDHAFLEACECSVATANALASLKERVDLVTRGDHGAGVEELIGRMLATDLDDVERSRARHRVHLGARAGGGEARIDARGTNVLVAGPSGSGKSTASTAIVERLLDLGYQVAMIDPEGDYERFEGTISLGTAARAPSVDEVLDVLARPDASVVVNLLGAALHERPPYFAALFPRLQDLRARTGRPHWIVIDEAHHLLPADWAPAPLALPRHLTETMLVTVHPERVARAALASIDLAIAVGAAPDETLGAFARAADEAPPRVDRAPLAPGEVLLWRRGAPRTERVRVTPARAERLRHRRKYASGELGDHSFYFRGPEGRLNLRAQNLMLFMQIGDGVDDATWLHHLHNGDYARWFREKIKDAELAAEAEHVARARTSAADSRRAIRRAIEKRYAPPA